MRGDQLRALGRGMDAILLNRAGNRVHPRIEHGQKRDMVFRRNLLIDRVELPDIVRPIVGRESDPRQHYFASAFEQRLHHRVQIGPSRRARQPAKTVIAPELDDDHRGMERHDAIQPVYPVLGGTSADSLAEDEVMIAAGIEIALEVVWIAVTLIDAIAGGNAVAEANDDGDGAARSRVGSESATERDQHKEQRASQARGRERFHCEALQYSGKGESRHAGRGRERFHCEALQY